jgi:2-polyprenyl-3-methyl-5-hydroxy-6-metoxy-1,4-benzoquinol methylase
VTAPYAQLVAAHGLSDSHRLLAAAVPPGSRVLDVGCATGYLAAELARSGCAVTGVEPAAEAAAAARDQCEAVVHGDVEEADCRAELEALAPFDAIVCGDVLEHLRDPWEALAFVATLLAPGGRVAVSVPNIAHWTGRRALLRGRFDYAAHGLFDVTHLRFFTRSSAHSLVAAAGLRVVSEAFAPAPLPLQARLPALGRLAQRAATWRPALFALQVVLVAQRESEP